MIIATSTDCGPQANQLNKQLVKLFVKGVMSVNPHVVMVIKSNVIVGYTKLLRGGEALHDNIYPSGIVVKVVIVCQNGWARSCVSQFSQKRISIT